MSEKSLKERYETEFIPFLMDSIGDADKYQELWDNLFNQFQIISYKREKYSTVRPAACSDVIGHRGGIYSRNIDILFADWSIKPEFFDESLKELLEKYESGEYKGLIQNRIEEIKECEQQSGHNYSEGYLKEMKNIETIEAPKEVESVAAYTPKATITGNKPDTVLLQSLEELRNHLISYPETSLPKRPYTIPTVLPPKLLLVNKSTASLVKRTSYEFMLDFNNDYLKDCFDKNAPTNINNITERFEEWETKYGIPVIFSKLYTIFWNLLLIAMDDDLYNQYLSEAINLAHLLSIDENLLQDLCHGVGYVLAGKKLNQDCDLQCKTAECRTFFLHK